MEVWRYGGVEVWRKEQSKDTNLTFTPLHVYTSTRYTLHVHTPDTSKLQNATMTPSDSMSASASGEESLPASKIRVNSRRAP
jgi:hypothetical protein